MSPPDVSIPVETEPATYDFADWNSSDLEKARGYRPEPKLESAFRVALLLNQPLLLTGEPGTGKTQFAYYASYQQKLGPPLLFETKSSSTARDLFYSYDTLGRFHEAQFAKSSDNNAAATPKETPAVDQRDYITYNALGISIINTRERPKVQEWLPSGFEHVGPRRSVVLIDEIDKAPRDFPNDILNEIENAYFKIPEFRDPKTHRPVVIEANKKYAPILILTSNSEKTLPDAFLRRCIYYNIPFPEEERLCDIIDARLGSISDATAVKDAVKLFVKLRENSTGLRKKPATAELLNWLTSLRALDTNVEAPLKESKALGSTLNTLVKTAEDQHKAERIVLTWPKG